MRISRRHFETFHTNGRQQFGSQCRSRRGDARKGGRKARPQQWARGHIGSPVSRPRRSTIGVSNHTRRGTGPAVAATRRGPPGAVSERAPAAVGRRPPMSICTKLKTFLDDHHVRYVVTTHSPAFTSQEIAASVHIRGKDLVKCVMLSGDGRHYMVAMTANQMLNLDWLKEALGLRTARLESEEDFRALFADCEVGAMPPFGNLYGIPVVVDAEVYEDDEIAFNGGTHTSVVKMALDDFESLVQPTKAV